MFIYNKNFEGFIDACDLNITVNNMVRYAKVSRQAYKYFATQNIYINILKKKLRSPFCHYFSRLKLFNELTTTRETMRKKAMTMEDT